MPPEAPARVAEKRTAGAGASSRSSQSTPVAFSPATRTRLSARDTLLASRASVTLDPFLRVEPNAIASLRASSGVTSMLARPVTPCSENKVRAPRPSQMIDLVTTAPGSTVLKG